MSTPPKGLQKHVPLAPLLTLGTGGAAHHFCKADDEATLAGALHWARRSDLPCLLLGGGSNIVCSDDGFDGLVIHVALRGVESERRGDRVRLRVAAGEEWDMLVRRAVAEGLAGVECLSGIPGQVGATPIQNVGAYGQEVAETIAQVRCLDTTDGSARTFTGSECGFGYRHSRFKGDDAGRFAILSVDFVLKAGGSPRVAYPDLEARLDDAAPSLGAVRAAVLDARRAKSMLLDAEDPNGRSCGSFFLNPVVSKKRFEELQRSVLDAQIPHYPQPTGDEKVAAAWLIERAGFRKGQREGNVGLSTKHALSIVAHEGATSSQIRAFAVQLKQAVLERVGIELSAEPRFVGFPPP